MGLSSKGLRVHPDWRRQWQSGEGSPYPSATPHDIAWHFGREVDRQNPDDTIEDSSIDTGLAEVEDGRAHPASRHEPVIAAAGRVQNIRDDAPGRFSLEPMKEEPTRYRGTHFVGRQRVAEYDPIIEKEAKRQGVDTDLVRAIIYAENARGWFKDDVLLKYIGEPLLDVPIVGPHLGRERKTILPMNIHRDVWRSLVKEEGDFFVPEKNIEAGVTLIKRIAERLDDPSPEKIATLYNQTDRNSVTPWGDLVARAYAARAWELPFWTQRPDEDADRVPRTKWPREE